MKVLAPIPPAQRNYKSLLRFLKYCREAARAENHYKIASISLLVKHIDPLAVLESIYEPRELHFYLEHPVREEAVAGAEAILCKTFSGETRFQAAHHFSDHILEHTIAIGDLKNSFHGPRFFCAFTFFEEEEENAFFPSATVFLPRWQVSRHGGAYGAIANVLIEPESNLPMAAAKVWKAHRRFSSFSYESPPRGAVPPAFNALTPFEIGGEDGFEGRVATALQRIAAGQYEKIVLARAVDLKSHKPFHPLESLNRLRIAYQGCSAFSFANGKGRSFIGATPESLLKVSGNRLFTEALAGSAPRGYAAAEDARFAHGLLESDKDLREHRLVIDSIIRRLKTLGITPRVAPSPQLLQLSNVQHLKSPIEADIPPGIHLLDLASVLHPTPAVGGVPRDAAVPDIRTMEPFERGLYAGTLGWFDYKGYGEMVVAIRSALIDGRRARVYAGNGIVKGSVPKDEKKETDLKLQAILKTLQ